MAMVSVVIPCYNHGKYVDDAVTSVLEQTYQDLEIIIVDDGSDDPETVDKLSAYSKPKTIVHRIPNGGLASARNAGISKASGQYILPLDADDKIGSTYVEKAVAVLKTRPDVSIVYCEAEFFGLRTGKWNLPPFSLELMLYRNVIFASAFFRKSQWEAAGGYNPKVSKAFEDWDFWLSLIKRGGGVYQIPETLFYYRIKEASMHKLGTFGKIHMGLRIIANHFKFYITHVPQCLKGRALFKANPAYRQ